MLQNSALIMVGYHVGSIGQIMFCHFLLLPPIVNHYSNMFWVYTIALIYTYVYALATSSSLVTSVAVSSSR